MERVGKGSFYYCANLKFWKDGIQTYVLCMLQPKFFLQVRTSCPLHHCRRSVGLHSKIPYHQKGLTSSNSFHHQLNSKDPYMCNLIKIEHRLKDVSFRDENSNFESGEDFRINFNTFHDLGHPSILQ